MTRKPTPKWDDPEESERFLETAKAVEASEDRKDFDKALKTVAPSRSK
jgi:hypothetical protein